MASNLLEEELLKRLREKLNQEKIKLWLPPYTTEDHQKGIQPNVKLRKFLILYDALFLCFS